MKRQAKGEDWRNGGFGLYVHWPFCAAKCPYCDFNSYVVENIDEEAWRSALVKEIHAFAAVTQGRVLNSIFFGGGTPSLMPATTVQSVIDTARQVWMPANDIEISLEANPTSAEAQRFHAYRDAGVTRLSLGVQAINDDDLRLLGRLHTAGEALKALQIGKSVFDNVSIDIIYARQFQTLESWGDELREIINFAPDHLSLYQLTIEDGTAFGERHARGRLPGLATDDLGADMYELTQNICDGAGLSRYEISNHARTGAEARHNLIYWRYGDYVGVGPGAHGRVTAAGARLATESELAPAKWLQSVESKGSGTIKSRVLSGREQAEEMAMMGLRLTEGISLTRFEALAGTPINPSVIERLRDLSLVDTVNNTLFCTEAGRPLLNPILADLLAECYTNGPNL